MLGCLDCPPGRASREGVCGAGADIVGASRAAGASAVALPALSLAMTSKARAAGSKKLTGLTATLLQEIMNDEAQHVPIIKNLLDDAANPLPVPIRKPPNFNMAALRQPTLQTFL